MFSDQKTNLDEMKLFIKSFCEERDWDQFHGAKDLAIGAITEASELLEHFRFLTEQQIEDLMSDSGKKIEISDELADVLFFILRFSQKYNIDLSKSFSRKMEKNNQRYPASEFRGKNHKASH